MLPRKHSLPLHVVVVLTALITIVLYHYPLYTYVHDHLPSNSGGALPIAVSVVAALVSVQLFLWALFGAVFGKAFRHIVAFFFVANAVALYFVQTYHAILDRSMMGNVFHTDLHESTSYLGREFALYLSLFGLLPALLFYKGIAVGRVNRLKTLLTGIAALLAGAAILYVNASTWLWIDKHAKYLGGLTMPWSYTINAVRYQIKEAKRKVKTIPLPSATFDPNDKRLVILVIGESARAHNFSLYGYARETNPELSKEDLVIVPHALAAATYTTASIHAMLSYKGDTDDDYEPLPDFLQRMGVAVIWRSNNSGEPRLHVGTYQKSGALRRTCKGEACRYDGVLLHGLEQAIRDQNASTVFVVLHTAGSHGPSYDRKYPSAFARFKPICHSVDLKSCTETSLINAYDNTILYTDHLLAETIRLLKRFDDRKSALVYVSDHGESLGESHLYLHGTPNAIAPEYQRRIPYVVWLSPAMKRTGITPRIDPQRTYGHDTVFHTIAGLLGMQGGVYRPDKDLFVHPDHPNR